MDDETYVKMDFKQIPGQCYYASKVRGNVRDKYKYVMTDKFPKKLMIWQALCSCGKKSPIHVCLGNRQFMFVWAIANSCLFGRNWAIANSCLFGQSPIHVCLGANSCLFGQFMFEIFGIREMLSFSYKTTN